MMKTYRSSSALTCLWIIRSAHDKPPISALALHSGFAKQKIAFHHHPAELFVKFSQLTLAHLIVRSEMIGELPGRCLHQRLLPRVDLVRMSIDCRRPVQE